MICLVVIILFLTITYSINNVAVRKQVDILTREGKFQDLLGYLNQVELQHGINSCLVLERNFVNNSIR